MYVKNGKISNRQIFRLYVFDLMGIATLLVPPYLAEICGMDGVWGILLGTALGFGYLFYLGWVMKQMETDMYTFLREKKGVVARSLMISFVLIHCILTAGFCSNVFANLMQYSLIRESSFPAILLVIILVAAYAVSGGIESRARVYEVLFLFVIVPYIAMMLASVKDFDLGYVDGLFRSGIEDVLQGAYLVFLFLTPLFFSLFLVGEREQNYEKNMVKIVSLSITVSAIILLGSYVLLVGNFGIPALSSMKYPVVTLMSTIQFEGNFLKRMDALMVAVWFFTLFALLNLHLHYGVGMLKELSSKKQLTWWQLAIPAALVYGVGYGLQMISDGMQIFVSYYIYVAVPVMVLAPLVLLWRRK